MDSLLLKYHIASKDMSLSDIAGLLGVSPSTLNRKMKEESEFTRNEIKLIKDELNLSDDDMNSIFFN